MAQQPKQPCKECHALADGPYCEQHKHLAHANSRAYDAHRRKNDPFRRYYLTARWRAVRLIVLARDIMCRMGKLCEGREFATEVDHITPARVWVANGGDFYDESNLQGLCSRCHKSKTAEERARSTDSDVSAVRDGLGDGTSSE